MAAGEGTMNGGGAVLLISERAPRDAVLRGWQVGRPPRRTAEGVVPKLKSTQLHTRRPTRARMPRHARAATCYGGGGAVVPRCRPLLLRWMRQPARA